MKEASNILFFLFLFHIFAVALNGDSDNPNFGHLSIVDPNLNSQVRKRMNIPKNMFTSISYKVHHDYGTMTKNNIETMENPQFVVYKYDLHSRLPKVVSYPSPVPLLNLYDQFEDEQEIAPIVNNEMKSIDLGNYVIMREGRNHINYKSTVNRGFREKKKFFKKSMKL